MVPYFLSEIVREICLLAKSLRSEDSTSLLVFHAMYLRCLNKPEEEGGKVSTELKGVLFKSNLPELEIKLKCYYVKVSQFYVPPENPKGWSVKTNWYLQM